MKFSLLSADLATLVRELRQGLRQLNFNDNFKCFIVENLSIPASSEVKIANELNPIIPSGRLLIRSNSTSICDGDTAWTQTQVTLKNTGASAATVTVVFFK